MGAGGTSRHQLKGGSGYTRNVSGGEGGHQASTPEAGTGSQAPEGGDGCKGEGEGRAQEEHHHSRTSPCGNRSSQQFSTSSTPSSISPPRNSTHPLYYYFPPLLHFPPPFKIPCPPSPSWTHPCCWGIPSPFTSPWKRSTSPRPPARLPCPA